ncbi:hypothetical protein [Sphingorhabdus sp. EL138]|jgi:hypothetical protein|nr:hypothetical protein [Sphingorhabdus sp. EL138]
MFTLIFIDAFGMIDKQAVEHVGISLSNAAVGNCPWCNVIAN